MHLEPSPPLAAAPAPDETAPRRRNYVARHWRGELSLPVAYWINAWLLGIVATVLGIAAQATLFELRDPRTVVAIGVALLLLGITLPVWQIVGVWRSAGRHKARGGSGFWAGVARVLMVLNGLGVFVALARDGAPQLPVFYAMVMGEPGAKHELSILENGSEAVFAGQIGFGLTSEIEALLDAHPDITVLHLSSRGGRILEARRLHDVIRRRGLTTVSQTLCASACTIAFMGGKERLITGATRVGFHQGTVAGGTSFEVSLIESGDRRLMLEDGVDRAFVARAFATPNSEVWYPTADEMLSAHFVTRILPGAPAAAADGGGERDGLKRLGFYGRWAVDCRVPASRANPVVTLAPSGAGEASYHLAMGGSPPDADMQIHDMRATSEREVAFTMMVRGGAYHVVARQADGRMRSMQSVRDDGTVVIKDGILLATGKETPSLEKCE